MKRRPINATGNDDALGGFVVTDLGNRVLNSGVFIVCESEPPL